MIERASIRFHKVKSCGLYRQRARNSEMGSFTEIVNNIYNWSSSGGRLIQNTCTYEVNEDTDMDFLETYLVSMKHDPSSGDYFVAMWNRTHDSGDSVYALDPSTTVDNLSEGALHRGNLPSQSIPGYATYFWLMPSQNTIATITFGTPRTGMKPFSHWLESFIKTESRYVRFDENDQFLGYAIGNNQPNNDLVARFTRTLHKNPAKRDLILRSREQIRGVIRRINLDRGQPVHEGAVDKLLNLIGIANSSGHMPHEIPLTYELNYTPSEAELNQIIVNYESGQDNGSWQDVGFKFPQNNVFGADEKEWLSKSYSKGKISIDVEWVVAGQLLNMVALKASINSRREELEALLPAIREVSASTQVA
jgi:hypothetical protein